MTESTAAQADHDARQDQLELHTANAPDGEPLVVMGFGGRTCILTLLTATELATAITTAVAQSVIKDPVEPTEAPRIQLQ